MFCFPSQFLNLQHTQLPAVHHLQLQILALFDIDFRALSLPSHFALNAMSRLAYELAIHVLQQRIKEKVAVLTDFANSSTQIRFLTNQLAFYDRSSKRGYLSIDDFVRYFVQRMNFNSLTNELEYLFYHYDEEITGFLDYKNFVNQLYQSTQYYQPVLTIGALNTFEQIRRAFISPEKNEQHDFLRFVLTLRDRIHYDTDGFASQSFVVKHLKEVIASKNTTSCMVSDEDISALTKFFDFRKNETVHIPTFFRYLKSIISPYRKRLIQAVYKMLESYSHNCVTVRDIKTCYHLCPSTTIRFRGKMFVRATSNELLRYFFLSDTHRMQDNWKVTKEMFYEYYHCISLAIESDELFELTIRHSWSIPNALLFGKPMANIGENVFERAISTSFDTTTTNEEVLASLTSMASQSMELNSVISKSMDIGSLASQSLDDGFVSPSISLELSTPRSKKLSPTAITATRTPSRRIVTRRLGVVHSDDTEEMVMIEEEIGITKFDHESISRQLKTMGITDIKFIKV